MSCQSLRISRLEHGEAATSIAKRLGVTPEMIHTIRKGRAWRELPRAVMPAKIDP